jgi:hypothetical protein|tara:strand:- start:853 stop:2217 length:1365 start_codon:yes stop_codon:yes gene_type:complete
MKKSPLKYNANLVQNVIGAYQSSNAMSQATTQGVSSSINKVMKNIADASKQKKDKLLTQNVAKNANVDNFNETEVRNLINFKDQYDKVATKLSRPFLSKKNKAELNQQLNKINKATATYVGSVKHIVARQKEALSGDKSRSSVYDHQQHMTWDRFATGEARDEASSSVDYETGEMFIQDPYGSAGDTMNVMNWAALKTVDSKWLRNDTKTSKTSNTLAKDLNVSPEIAKEQITNEVSNNYYSNPSAIWDHASNRNNEFADYLISSDNFETLMMDKYPSEFGELQSLEANRDDDGFYDLIKQKARTEDMSEYWIQFRAAKQMRQFNLGRQTKEIDTNASGNSDTKYTSAQKIKFNTFVRSFNSGGNIYIGDGTMVKKNSSGEFELYNDKGQPLLKPGSRTTANNAGEIQVLSYDDLINKASLPIEYVSQLDEDLKKDFLSGPFPGVGNTNVPKLP